MSAYCSRSLVISHPLLLALERYLCVQFKPGGSLVAAMGTMSPRANGRNREC